MYVSANININNATVPALPKDAIVKDGEKYYVFIQEEHHEEPKKAKQKEEHVHKMGEAHSEHAEGEEEEEHNEVHFEAVEVIIGTTDLGYTEVKFVKEIPVDAKIVIKGAFYLLSAMKGGGSHEH
jgi:cobalt-zinc-cadmium efflux system membrane fusion protein